MPKIKLISPDCGAEKFEYFELYENSDTFFSEEVYEVQELPPVGGVLFMVYVSYRSGDSFKRDEEDTIATAAVCDSWDAAQRCKERLIYQCEAYREHGSHYGKEPQKVLDGEYKPWIGYFETVNYINVAAIVRVK